MSAHDETVAAWLKEAADDMKAPSLGAVLRWTARVANVKGVAMLAERALRQQETLELQCRFRADGMPSDAAAQLVLANGPSDIEVGRARADYSTAVELLELAERIARLLERPRPTVEKPAAKLGMQQGGKR